MKHSHRISGHNNVAFQNTSTPQGSLQGPLSAPSISEPLSYTRGAQLSNASSLSMHVPALPSRSDVNTGKGGERLRLTLVLLLSIGFAALVLFMLYLSTGSPTVGLTAQRDDSGLWRVQSLVPAGLSYDAGVHSGDMVIAAFDSAGTPIDLAKLDPAPSNFRFATTIIVRPVSVTTGANVPTITVDIGHERQDNPLQHWGYTLLSLVFFAVGGPVFIKARQRSGAIAFYFFCMTTAVALAVAPAMYIRSSWLMASVFLLSTVWPGSFVLFFLKFPVRVGKTKLRHSMIVATVIACQLALVLGYTWVLLAHIAGYESLRVLLSAYMSSCILAGLIIMLRSLINEKSAEVRQQLVLLLGGTALAVGPIILLTMLPAVLINKPLVNIEVSSLALVIMPLAFAYAITQGQLLGIHNFVRRGVVYVLMGFIVLLVFSMAAAGASAVVPDGWWKSDLGLLGFGFFVFLLSLSFGYVQRRVERMVDRYIYHDAYDYKEALLQFSAQLASEQNLHVLADQLVERTCRLINLSCGVLLLASQPRLEHAQLDTHPQPASTNADRETSEAEAEYNSFMLSSLSRTDRGPADAAWVRGKHTPLDNIHLEPYSSYGALAESLLNSLQAALSNLGIVLRQVDISAQFIHLDVTQGGDSVVLPSSDDPGFHMTPNRSPIGTHVAQSSASFDGVRSYLCVPLWTRSYFVGVLCLGGKKSGERFTKDDISLLNTLGSQAALAIYNAQLYEAREQALLDTIAALAHAIEAKDTYTISHCEKITARAVAVAQAMALPRHDIENIRLGSILHDVGKIGVPDAVLNKPSKLTDEEYEIIKQHAQIGARIVQSVGALQGVVPIVRHHQERYDGRGYPDGLAGMEIPVGARIIAAVDAYGAMTEDRVYRKALGHEKAIAELKRYAGTQFDPHVVNTFIHILKEQPELAEADTCEFYAATIS